MTRAQKFIIAVMALLTVAVFTLIGVLVLQRINASTPQEQALATSTQTATETTTTVAGTVPRTGTASATSIRLRPTTTLTATRAGTELRPTATPTPRPVATVPTPTPVGVACASWDMPHSFGFFDDPDGRTHFVGEPRNTGNIPRESVLVIIRLFNRQGQFIGSTSAPLMRDVIAPAQSSPFNAVLAPPAPDWQRYALEFRCNVPGITSGTPYNDLQVTSDKGQAGPNSTYAVSGEIKNTGKEKAQAVQAIVVLYDVNGWVINARAIEADPADVAAGATAAFKMDFESVAHPVSKYAVYAQGELAR